MVQLCVKELVENQTTETKILERDRASTTVRLIWDWVKMKQIQKQEKTF